MDQVDKIEIHRASDHFPIPGWETFRCEICALDNRPDTVVLLSLNLIWCHRGCLMDAVNRLTEMIQDG